MLASLLPTLALANTVSEATIRSSDSLDASLDRFDDENARADISDVVTPQGARRFVRTSTTPSHRRWYRLRLSPDLERSGPWVLTALFQSATLFEPSGAGYRAEAFGADIPVASRRVKNGLMNVDLRPGDYGRDLFIRIEGDTEPGLAITTASDVAQVVQQRDIAYTFYIVVYGVLTIAALLFAAATRAKAFAYYAVYIGTQAFLKISWLPFAARTLWPQHAIDPAIVDAIYSLVWPAAYFQFLRHALETRTWPRADRIMIGCAVLSAILISGCNLVDDIVGMQLRSHAVPYIFVATLVIGGIVTFVRWRQRFVSAGFYLFGIVALIIGVVCYPFVNYDTADVGFIIEAFAFLAALAFRLVAMTNERQRALVETLAAREAVALEYAQRIAATELFNRAFSRFVPQEFLVQLGRKDVRDVALGDHVERNMTVMFCDIRSFVSFSERMTPEAMFQFLNRYFGRIGPIIRKHGGFIDKYLGDGVMALFSGAADGALLAAVDVQSEVRRLNEARARDGEAQVEIGIGLHRGPIMLATVGEAERYDTTVVADVVNLASRLEGMTGLYGARIVASDAVVSTAHDLHAFNRRWLGEMIVRGASASLSAYEICDGDPAELLLHKRATAATFARAIDDYRRGDYSTSRMLFDDLREREPDDLVATYFAERSRQRGALVDSAWDGVERHQFKR